MVRRAFLAWILVFPAIACLLAATSYALEKLTLGTSYKRSADYYLVYYAAEEQEFWKQEGLEVNYISLHGGNHPLAGFPLTAWNVGAKRPSDFITCG